MVQGEKQRKPSGQDLNYLIYSFKISISSSFKISRRTDQDTDEEQKNVKFNISACKELFVLL